MDNEFVHFYNVPNQYSLKTEPIKNINVNAVESYETSYERFIHRFDNYKVKIENGEYAKERCIRILNELIKEIQIFIIQLETLERIGMSLNIKVDQVKELIFSIEFYIELI